jgi:outer membrane protein
MRLTVFVFGLALAESAMAEVQGLSQIYNLAVANDPSLSAEVAGRSIAIATRDKVIAGKGLSVDGTVTGSRTDNLVNDDNFQTGSLSMKLTLPVFNRALDASIVAQEANVRSADAKLKGYRQAHIVKVAEVYFRVLSAEQDLQATHAEVVAFERQLEQAQERLSVGIGTRVDVDQARAKLDLSKVELISHEVALETAKSDVEQLIDRPVTGLADFPFDFVEKKYRKLNREIDSIVLDHPNVVAKFEAYQSALADLDKSRASLRPKLDLSSTFSIGDSSGGSSSATNASTRKNVLALTLSAPIFSNGANESALAVSAASVIKADAELASIRRKVRASIQVALRMLEASARTLEARRLVIVSAASRVEATEVAYSVGSGDIVEVLNAKKDLIAAERDLAKTRHTHALRELGVGEAVGDLSEEAIFRIDDQLIQ